MASSNGKHNMPKDTQIIVSMMKDLGIVEYDQQVLNHLLEFNYRYTTQILEDAKKFSNFAKKKNIDADDVKLAIQMEQSGVFCKPPPHDTLMTAAREVNKVRLPPATHASRLRIPQDGSNFLQTNYRLRKSSVIVYPEKSVCTGENMRKDTKTTAAEMLEASKRIETGDRSFLKSSEMKNPIKVELEEMIENRQSSQESIGENYEDEDMDA